MKCEWHIWPLGALHTPPLSRQNPLSSATIASWLDQPWTPAKIPTIHGTGKSLWRVSLSAITLISSAPLLPLRIPSFITLSTSSTLPLASQILCLLFFSFPSFYWFFFFWFFAPEVEIYCVRKFRRADGGGPSPCPPHLYRTRYVFTDIRSGCCLGSC